MCIYSPPGSKVRFDGRGGQEYEKEYARTVFTVGGMYEVTETTVGNCVSGVRLVGFEGFFNTVMFDRV